MKKYRMKVIVPIIVGMLLLLSIIPIAQALIPREDLDDVDLGFYDDNAGEETTDPPTTDPPTTTDPSYTPQPPYVDASGPYGGSLGTTIHFVGYIYPCSSNFLTGYSWDFGDGDSYSESFFSESPEFPERPIKQHIITKETIDPVPPISCHANHTFTEFGFYTATLTVYTDLGTSASDEALVFAGVPIWKPPEWWTAFDPPYNPRYRRQNPDPIDPETTFNKKVWNENIGDWDETTQVPLGEEIQFSISFTANRRMTNIQIIDHLPPTVRYVSATSSPSMSKEIYFDVNTSSYCAFTKLIWNLGTKSPGETVNILINGTVEYLDKSYFNILAHWPDYPINYTTKNVAVRTYRGYDNGCNNPHDYIARDEASFTITTGGPRIGIEKKVKWNCCCEYDDEITIDKGQWVTFKIEVTNTGETPLDITIRDELPAGLTYKNNATPGEPDLIDGNNYYWYFYAVAPQNTITVTFQAWAYECGSFTNIANATGIYENEVITDEDNATVNVPCEPGISVDKKVKENCCCEYDDEITIDKGQWVTFKIEVTNTGETPLDITIRDELPAGLTYKNNATPGEPDLIDGNNYYWYFYAVAPQNTITVTFQAWAYECGSFTNIANATGIYENEVITDEDNATVYVLCESEPNISVQKRVFDPLTENWTDSIDAQVGNTVKFNISVHNDGTCDLTDVIINDYLPCNLEYVNSSATIPPTKICGRNLIWEIGESLSPFNWIYIEFNATVISCLPCNISFVQPLSGVDGDISGWSNGNAVVNLNNDSWSLLGGASTVTGYINGHGILTHRGTRGLGVFGQENDEVDSYERPERIEITFGTPYYLNYLEVRSLFTNDSGWRGTEEGDVDLYLNGTFVANYHLSGVEDFYAGTWGNLSVPVPDILIDRIVFYVKQNECYTSHSEFAVAKLSVNSGINTVNVSGYCEIVQEKVYDEDNATVNITCEPKPEPNISIEKKVSTDNLIWDETVSVYVDNTVYFDITVTNEGNVDLPDVVVTDYLPSFLTYNYDAIPAHSSASDHQVIWFFDNLPVGESVTIIFSANATDVGSDDNIANVTSCAGVSDEDSAHVDVEEQPQPGISIVKEASTDGCTWSKTASVYVGQTVYFRLNISNEGNIDLTNVIVTDTLPSFLTYDYNAIPTHTTASNHYITWSLGTLIKGQYVIITFSATANAVGSGNNTADVGSCVGVDDYDEAHVDVEELEGPNISVEKYVKWDCQKPFVKIVDAEIGDYVVFELYVNNTGETPLDVTVCDELPDGLTYADSASPKEPDYIDGNNYYWNFTDVQPGTSIIITFKADVDECGEHINRVNVTGEYECQDVYNEDTATVNVECDEEAYTLTVIIDGSGTVAKDPDQTSYPSDAVVELNATADSGWTFSHWSGDLIGSDNPDTITMDGDKTVTAHFTEDHDTPPTVEITKPKEYFLYKNNILRRPLLDKTKIIGPITIKVNAEDNVGVDHVEFYIDGVLKYTDESAPYQWTWWIRSSLKTNYTIKVIAYDTSDNSNSVEIDVVREGYRPLRNHPFLTLAGVVGGSALLLKKLLDPRSGEEETPEEEPEIPEEPEEEPEEPEPVEHEAPKQTEGEEGGEAEIFWYIVGALSLIFLIAVVLLLVRRKYYV